VARTTDVRADPNLRKAVVPVHPGARLEGLTPAERVDHGRATRRRVTRASHADWQPADGRDPIAILERQAEDRTPDLVPIRYGRMLTSPFAFYRGAAAIMAADLAPLPRTGLAVQLCGDAHLSNFGGFGTPERSHIFGVNDFDETLPGPFEWDVKRLAASFEVAARDRGFRDRARTEIVLDCVRAYRTGIEDFATMRNLGIWYLRLDTRQLLELVSLETRARHVRHVKRDVARARAKDHGLALRRLTVVKDGVRRFRNDPPLIVPADDLLPETERRRQTSTAAYAIRRYRTSLPDERKRLIDGYRFVEVARKVVGVGSVGTRAWIALFVGRDQDDPLILQLKEAQRSVLEPYLGSSIYPNHGRRVVEGQRLLQSASDILLGWFRIRAFDGRMRDFYVRQLWDGKYSADIETMSPRLLRQYARLCGWTLARVHARSGDRLALAGYLGRGDAFDRAIAAFSATYADQNERDYAALRDAVRTGRVVARTGV
jgi:uncharacterized protein (DUF2252 family)